MRNGAWGRGPLIWLEIVERIVFYGLVDETQKSGDHELESQSKQ